MASVSGYREIYENAPIDRNTPSIRLLSLSGKKYDYKNMEVLLQSFQLSSAPPYIAVSYTWGDPLPPPGSQTLGSEPSLMTRRTPSTRYENSNAVARWPIDRSAMSNTIKVNGKDFETTRNLRAYLDHIKRFDLNGEWYWIDAVCIDQNNNEERTYQVGMMGDIYSSARLVHIWLGPGSKDSDGAIEHMEKAVSWGGSVTYIPERVQNWLRELFHRTYWGRIWIFQEVLLAESIIVSCGNKTTGWGTLNGFYEILQRAQHDGVIKGNVEGIIGSNALRLIRNKQSIERLKTINMAVALAYLIDVTVSMQATDQRDKVYGLLGLSERISLPCKASRLQAAYNAPLSTVVADVLCYLAEGEVFQRHFNKILVTRQLKESLGMSDDDAYIAAQASKTMSEVELKQLKTVIKTKDLLDVTDQFPDLKSSGAASLERSWR